MNTSFPEDLRVSCGLLVGACAGRLRPPSATTYRSRPWAAIPRLAFPCRIGHEAVHCVLALGLLDLGPDDGCVAGRRRDPPPPLPYERLRLRAAGARSGRFGSGDGALGGGRRRAAGRAAVSRRRAGVVIREHGLLAQRASRVRCGRTRHYEDAVRNRILGPFGPRVDVVRRARPCLARGRIGRGGHTPAAGRPSGGLVSTVGDILRSAVRLLDEPSFAQMRTVQGRPIGGVYGFGLFGERVGRAEVWGHAGSYGGFQSSLLVVPDAAAVFVGLTNASDRSRVVPASRCSAPRGRCRAGLAPG